MPLPVRVLQNAVQISCEQAPGCSVERTCFVLLQIDRAPTYAFVLNSAMIPCSYSKEMVGVT